MKRAILAQLAKGPATFTDIKHATGAATNGHKRGRLLALLRELTYAQQIREPTAARPWYQLRKSVDRP